MALRSFLCQWREYFFYCIAELLTPLVLAFWICDDGGPLRSAMKLCTHSFSVSNIELLCKALNIRYSLNLRLTFAGSLDQFYIYIPSVSMPILANIVRPHIYPTLLYKLARLIRISSSPHRMVM